MSKTRKTALPLDSGKVFASDGQEIEPRWVRFWNIVFEIMEEQEAVRCKQEKAT